jgi:hypothetical protein
MTTTRPPAVTLTAAVTLTTSRTLPPTDADAGTSPVGRMAGTVADPARRALDVTDDAAPVDGLTDDDAAAILDGERCGRCKGFGLVRKAGRRAGEHYRSLAGAQAADGNGNAADCPDCHGLGLVGLDVPADDDAVVVTGRR